MKRCVAIATLLLLSQLPFVSVAGAAAFTQKKETFRIEDAGGKPVKFRVLDDGPTEKALGVAIITTVNSQKDFEPKLPLGEHIDLKAESLSFSPAEGSSDQLKIQARVSGHDFELPQTISRKDLLAGKPIQVDFPKTEKTIAIFDVRFHGGRMRFRYDAKKDELRIDEASGKATYESSFAGEGSESIQFSGRGVRLR